MAHRTTQRRTLAGADPNASSMDYTANLLLKRQPKATAFHCQNHLNPDPITIPSPKPSTEISISTTNLSKSLNSDHKIRSFQKPSSQNPPFLHVVDTHLQSKPKKKSLSCKEVEKKKLSKEEELGEVVQHVVSLKCSEDEGEQKEKKFGVVERYLGRGGGRRRSLCGTHVELADVFASNGVKVVSVDMPPFMQIQAVECARKTHDSLKKFTSKTLALTLKKEFDGAYGPAWHCIVGTSFGSFVTHSVGGFLYFSMDQKLYILLFKTTVQRADKSCYK